MDINQLRGEKKQQAILLLGEDIKNAELLLSLINSEKGIYKQAALTALVKLDFEPQCPFGKSFLKVVAWAKKPLLTKPATAFLI